MSKPGPYLLLLCAAILTAGNVTAQTPKITGFSPASACQGAPVTITGSHFKGATAVQLGTKPAGIFRIVDDNTITADIDSFAASGRVIVFAGDKSDTAATNIDIKITPKPGLKDIGAGDNKPFTNCDGNSNYTLQVQNNSGDVPAGSTYDISWGDGTPHFNQKDWGGNGTATHQYTRQGYFTITLLITPQDGCINQITQTFYNGANPLASLTTTTSTTGLCIPAPVGFIIGGDWKDNSTGTVYQLDYGDGNVQTLQHPLNGTGADQTVPHTYTQSSCPKIDYTATLNVINGCFTTTYTLNQIIVREKPKADFDAKTSVCLGDVVCFTNKTQAGYSGTACSTNTSYAWDFGDHTTSSSGNPGCHSYAAAGTYTVKLDASNLTCGSSTQTMQVTVHPVSPAPVAGAGQAYCQNQPAPPLKATGTNLQWYTSLTGTPGSPNAPTPNTSQPGNFTWYVTQTLPNDCESPRVAVAVTIAAAPQASISYPAICSTDQSTAPMLTGTKGGSFSSTTGLNIDPASGIINAAASQAGNYTVTYTIAAIAPCSEYKTTTNISITKAPAATISYTPSALCNAGAAVPVKLSGTSGGRFTISPASGLPVDAATGTISPSGAATGNYTITYTVQGTGGCGIVTASTTVSVSSAPSATISYGSVCTSDAQASVNLQGTAGGTFSAPAGLSINAATGAINPASSKPGTYTVTYTIAPSPPCAGFTTTASVTVTRAPGAAISYAKTNLCNVAGQADVTVTGDKGGVFTISPSSGLPIDQNTGQLTPSGATPGNYTISYVLPAGGGCSAVTATANVSVSSAPTATISYVAICSSDQTTAVSLAGSSGGTFSSTAGLVIDATTGAISPGASKPGTYTVTYTVAPEAPCPGYTTTTTVTITRVPAATISYPKTSLCNVAGPADAVITGDMGGVFSIAPAGLAINTTTGQLTPSGATPGNYTVTYTLPASGGCSAVTTAADVSVSSAPTATINYGAICSTDNTAAVTLTGSQGGTFSSTAGLAINTTTGVISPGASKPGTYTITYTIAAEAPCPGYTATTKITITQAPVATISYPKTTLCNVAGPSDVTITGDKGGAFSISPAGLNINATTGQLTPSGAIPGSYTVTYAIQAAGGCSTVTATTAVNVSSAPTATISYGAICSSDATAAVTLTGDNGGAFSAPPGLAIDAHTGAITPGSSTPGTYTVTYAIAPQAPCPGFTATASVTITKASSATISYNKPTLCNVNNTQQTPNPTVTIALTGDKGGVFTISPANGLPIDAATGTLTPSGATPGNYTIMYTLQGTGGCATFTTTTQVTVSEAPKAGFSYPGSPYCGGTTDPQLPQFNGTTGGVFTAPAGLAIDGSTGAINPAGSRPGSYTVTYTITAEAPCPGFTTTATAEISASPQTSFPISEQSICSGGTASFTPSADVQQTVFNWVLGSSLPAGITGPISGEVAGSGTPIVLSYTNTTATGQALHIEVSPVNPSANPCPGAPVELILHVNPVPAAMTGDTTQFCMHATTAPLTASPAAGNTVKWYDAGNNPLNGAPVPSTLNPALFIYYATQSNTYGCESPRSPFAAVIHPVAEITASSFTNPTSCGLPGGTIKLHITDLNGNPMPNTPLTVAYLEFNTVHTQPDTSDANSNITMPLVAGQFSRLVVNTYGCPSATLDKTFELKDPTPPSRPLAGYNDTLCTGADLILSAASATSSIPGPVNYVWVGPAFGSSPDTTQQTTITFPNATPGYQGTYIVYAMQDNCISPATSFPVTVRQGPTKPTIVTRTPLCVGDLLSLQAYSTILGNYPLQFTWNGPGRGFPVNSSYASISSVAVQDGGIYSVSVYAPATGCSVTSDTLISIGAIPQVMFNPDTLLLPTGYKIALVPIITNANEPGVLPVQTYAWSPTANLACNDSCSRPVLTVAGNACYTLKVTNTYGCSGTANICVQAFCTDAQVFIPNAFTPRNGLPENRVFMVRASGIAAVRSLRVFNRWGKVVFEKHDFAPNDAAQGWDGTVNGKPADTGVYVYMVDVVCENGIPYTYKGNVTLLQ